MKPRLQILEPTGNYLAGFGEKIFHALDRRRKEDGEFFAEEFHKKDGFLIQVRSSESHNFVRITGGFSGFLCHPRTGEIDNTRFDIYTFPPSYEAHRIVSGNGFNPRGEALPNGPYAYPIVDDDRGTRGVYLKGAAWAEKKNPPENYGNIYWRGPKDILTWKGPPSRHFPLNQYLEIPGLTQLDYYIAGTSGDYSQYTPFSKNVYRLGAVEAVAPNVNYPRTDVDVDHGGQVLGAAYFTKDGAKWMVIAVKAIFTVATRPRAGYFYQVYAAPSGTTNPDGWTLVGERSIGHKPLVPFFFNQSGTEAQTVDANQLWKISIDTDSLTATFTVSDSVVTAQETTTSTVTETDAAAPIRATVPNGTYHPLWWYPYGDDTAEYDDYIKPLQNVKGLEITSDQTVNVVKSGERIFAVDYKGDTPVYAKAKISGSESSRFYKKACPAFPNTYGGVWGDVYYIPEYEPDVHVLGVIQGPDTAYVGAHYMLANECRGSWSFSHGTMNDDGEILTNSFSSCDDTGTITYENYMGTRTKTVTATKTYTTTDTETAPCSADAMGFAYQYFSGGRYIVYWGESDISASLTVYTPEQLAAAVPTTSGTASGCADGEFAILSAQYNWPGGRYFIGLNGNIYYVVQNGEMRECTFDSAGYDAGWVGRGADPDDEIWYYSVYESGGKYGYTGCKCFDFYCGRFWNGGWFRGADTGTCGEFLSDSYKLDLVDGDGNPVTVPDTSNGNLVKVYRVDTQECSVTT